MLVVTYATGPIPICDKEKHCLITYTYVYNFSLENLLPCQGTGILPAGPGILPQKLDFNLKF